MNNKFYKYDYYCKITSNIKMIDIINKLYNTDTGLYKLVFIRKLSLFWGFIIAEAPISSEYYFKTYDEAYEYYLSESTKYLQYIELLTD